ncbi:hypothetical protein A3A74_03160 [Candidatus Roizmanbacteria bacterium RIFCSPLOWO2_01_FULL_35_13]|uniref:DUF5678 domain-containing protein n=1 Tax=Candidatus Roizmanbacteria bacterium RIFCSPLOWO2_01_FULL_35_13 TaxID=1802055 RepID=A0A1F7IHV1_9BACT|nr:MAG: hypothetical protein A3A74_03160 [Candidatus Roizmanbacteria bacterium RIFCSPLOWO2_01_FULL_35_13]
MKNVQNFTLWMKKYGPGFVAVSKKSGRVLVAGKNLSQVWEKAEGKKLNFKQLEIMRVPRYETVKLYRVSF